MKKRTIALVAFCVCACAMVGIAAAQQPARLSVAGTWAVTIYGTPDGTLNQQWTIKQTGGNITGTAKDPKKGEMPIEGKFNETNPSSLRGTITEGTTKHLFIVTVTPDAFDGTFRIAGGRAEFLLRSKRAK